MLPATLMVLAASVVGVLVGRWARRRGGASIAVLVTGAYLLVVLIVLLVAATRMR